MGFLPLADIDIGVSETRKELPLDISSRIAENTARIEKQREADYQEAANLLGISPDEVKLRLSLEVKRIVGKSNLFIAISTEKLLKVFEGKLFKSQFETNESAANLDLAARAKAEEAFFGIKADGNAQTRPIYGYISDGAHGEISSGKEYGRRNWNTSNYGPVVIELNDSVKDRTTIVFDDSLGLENDVAASQFKDPHISSIKPGVKNILDILSGKVVSSLAEGFGGKYIEAQYHGGLSLDDIKAIHVSEHNGMTSDEIAKIKFEQTVDKPIIDY